MHFELKRHLHERGKRNVKELKKNEERSVGVGVALLSMLVFKLNKICNTNSDKYPSLPK